MKRYLALAVLFVAAQGFGASSKKAVLDCKIDKGSKKANVVKYQFVSQKKGRGKKAETVYSLETTLKSGKGKAAKVVVESHDFESSGSGDEDYNEYKIKVSGKNKDKILEKIGVSAAYVQEDLEWVNLIDDEGRGFARCDEAADGDAPNEKNTAKLVLNYAPGQKSEVVQAGIFKASRFKGNKVYLTIYTGQDASLITNEDYGPESVCYEGDIDQAAEIVEKMVNALDQNGDYALDTSSVSVNKKKVMIEASYTVIVEDNATNSEEFVVSECAATEKPKKKE